VQGNFFSVPRPAADIAALLELTPEEFMLARDEETVGQPAEETAAP
jgi:hypothetical protein